MLAVMVMALVGVSIYRFVVTDLQAIQIATADSARKSALQSLVSVLQDQMLSLPTGQENAIKGEAHKFNGKEADQLEWLTQSGNGLFTASAPAGAWRATLLLRQEPGSESSTLGLLRIVEQTDKRRKPDIHWLPLLPGVDALEIRYFNLQTHSWADKWNTSPAMPSVVRLRLWQTGQEVPYEAILPLPPAKLPS